MESRSSARGGDRGHLDHHQQVLLLRPAAAWSYSPGGGGVSWPTQRSPSSSSYTCGYCKRDFRSAQALGGHMNVHRRERAMIRHYYCSSYPTAPAPAAVHRDRVPNLNFSPPQHYCTAGDCASTATPAVYSFFSTAAAAEAKTASVVDLQLGIGEGGGGLDLELRLGCS